MCFKGKIIVAGICKARYITVCYSVCLPTVLIPIIKLSTSPRVLSEEFRPSKYLQVICWILAVIVIAFDIYLFMQHATDLQSAIVIGVFGTVYIIFLIYLTWKPLESKVPDTVDGWMSLPQTEDDLQLAEGSNSKKHTVMNNSDSEEIYPL